MGEAWALLSTVPPWCLNSSAVEHRFGLGCRCMHVQRRLSLSCTSNGKGTIVVLACVFCIFRALLILNGYCYSAQLNGLEILIPNHMRESNIGHLEQILVQKR